MKNWEKVSNVGFNAAEDIRSKLPELEDQIKVAISLLATFIITNTATASNAAMITAHVIKDLSDLLDAYETADICHWRKEEDSVQ